MRPEPAGGQGLSGFGRIRGQGGVGVPLTLVLVSVERKNEGVVRMGARSKYEGDT